MGSVNHAALNTYAFNTKSVNAHLTESPLLLPPPYLRMIAEEASPTFLDRCAKSTSIVYLSSFGRSDRDVV